MCSSDLPPVEEWDEEAEDDRTLVGITPGYWTYFFFDADGADNSGGGQIPPYKRMQQKQLRNLKDCVKKLYGINLRTFVPVAPGSNGYFYGLSAEGGGVTVETNVTHSSWYLGLTVFPPGGPVAGKTAMSKDASQVNYVASDELFMAPGLIQPTQIHELAHSLDQITSGSIFGSSEASADRLLNCVNTF